MKLHVFETYRELSLRAVSIVAGQVLRKPDSVLGLATGATPVGLYEGLAELCRRALISFAQIRTFNLDEYVGLSKHDPQSYAHFMQEHLFRHTDIDPDNVHLLDGTTRDARNECERYEAAIEQAGGIDLQVLGMGRNGHIGFNEPGSPFGGRTRKVRLSEDTVARNSAWAGTSVPRESLSMGLRTIMNAREIVLLVSGKDKAPALADALGGPVVPDVPASILQLHPAVSVFADRASASLVGSGERALSARR